MAVHVSSKRSKRPGGHPRSLRVATGMGWHGNSHRSSGSGAVSERQAARLGPGSETAGPKLATLKRGVKSSGASKLLRAVVGGHRLSSADAADVVQTTWLRLAENLDRLQDPSRVGAWLATTARRECLRTLRKLARERPDERRPSLSAAGWRPST